MRNAVVCLRTHVSLVFGKSMLASSVFVKPDHFDKRGEIEAECSRECSIASSGYRGWMMNNGRRLFYLLLCVLLLLAIRLGHLTGPVDEPNSWRQCDTAFYALDFHREGIDLLHPSVRWMGGHKTGFSSFRCPRC